MKLDYEALSIFKYESTDDTDDEELFNKIDDFTNSHINYYQFFIFWIKIQSNLNRNIKFIFRAKYLVR